MLNFRHFGLAYTVINIYSNILCCQEQLREETCVTFKKQAVKSCNKGTKKKGSSIKDACVILSVT